MGLWRICPLLTFFPTREEVETSQVFSRACADASLVFWLSAAYGKTRPVDSRRVEVTVQTVQ